jgi:hypothetical protein
MKKSEYFTNKLEDKLNVINIAIKVNDNGAKKNCPLLKIKSNTPLP